MVASSDVLAHFSAMRIVHSIRSMQRQSLAWKRAGVPVAFVPTMGYLHAGHLSLVRQARKLAGAKGKVVVSIYVNPTQFGPREDFKKYPRDLSSDARACRREGVDVVFAPKDEEMYPTEVSGGYSTYVSETALSNGMEGRARPTHFRGVTTVVAKLFNLVLPDWAVFGAKDYQQGAVIQRMVRDLNFPVRVIVAPTFREKDGLAMSSRNKYLEGALRGQAVVLWRAIQRARASLDARSEPVDAGRLRKALKGLIESQPAARVDYVEFFDPKTLEAVRRVGRGTHLALAVFVGKTRLIDNARL
jgi:pantoate--beta-alanine ligase